MKYISTRGKAPALDFEQVLLTGLASDGGLYVPETLPTFSAEEIASMAGLEYPELARRIITPFVAGCIPDEDLVVILEKTYAEFRHAAIAPLVQVGANQWVLELFHGPTLAFKDFALQLLGRLLDYVLERRHQKVVIMGATSGDTGSAAIEGCRHCDNIDIFILHPHNRVSDVQRKQMTSVEGDNIHNLAVEGNFDDCQAMVKASFGDKRISFPRTADWWRSTRLTGLELWPRLCTIFTQRLLWARLIARWHFRYPPVTSVIFLPAIWRVRWACPWSN